MRDAFAALQQLTNRFQPLQTAEWDAFAAIWSPVSAKRKEQLTLAGEPERFIYFVLSGIQRVYFRMERKRQRLSLPILIPLAGCWIRC
jgi:CRP-like cAMP-binding protein